VMPRRPERSGDCPHCHRLDVSHRVAIGNYELRLCRQCADSYKRTAGVVIVALAEDA
jgi:hypothetical protein